MHELLPWYANGTLEPSEAAAFERHLADCADCRRELDLLKKLRIEIERHGAALLGDHPTPEQLVGSLHAEEGEVDPVEVEAVRRHLALCSSCGQEARWASGDEEARSPGPPRRPSRSARPTLTAIGWGALAAAAMLLLAVGLFLDRSPSPGGGTGVTFMALVEPTQRGASDVPEIVVAPDADRIHLLLPVDLPPDGFPATLEVMDARGRVIHRDETVDPENLYRGAFLLFSCRRTDCPDGRYVARLVPSGAPDAPTEYPFRLRTATAQP